MARVRVARCCGPRGKFAGILLMLAGLVLMMLIVPYWAWAGIICIVMILGGFIFWRFC